jgi:hypothetical protein
LPLYNADKIKGNATVFIHEGAKGARYCQGLIESNSVEAKAHPWRKELSGAVHVGWIGGALNPYRTDWSILRRNGIKKAYIICDNDTPGLRAVPIISEQILRECFKGFWVYIEEIDSFICSEMPEIARSEAVLNKMCAPTSSKEP